MATYNCIFRNNLGENLLIAVKWNCSIKELIHLYFKRKGKENLFINNLENTYFIYNANKIEYTEEDSKAISLFKSNMSPTILVNHLDYNKSSKDIDKIETIKDNKYICVEKAKKKKKIVAVKRIKKVPLKDDIKEEKCIEEIREKEFKEHIIKFNRELSIMKKCYCEKSVEIYDYLYLMIIF